MNAQGCKVDRRLSRCHRVPASAIQTAFDNGSKYVGRLMIMWLVEEEGASLRLGVVSGKKTFRRAVDRVRVRRRLREAYRCNRYRLTGKVDVVLVPRRGMLDAASTEIEEELLKLSDKAGILGDAGA